ENAITKHNAIKNCVVTLKNLKSKGPTLLAYLVSHQQLDAEAQKDFVKNLLTALKQKLPSYMVPSVCYFIDAIPLTANGKVDFSALGDPEQAVLSLEAGRKPETNHEIKLANIWQEVLMPSALSVNDNFFDLGGHSLIAASVVSRIRSDFSCKINIKDLFENPTIEELALLLENNQTHSALPAQIQKADRTLNLALSPSQQRLWVVDQMGGGSQQYNIPSALRLEGALNEHAFENSIRTLIERHEVLRTHFIADGGMAHQVIKQTSDFPLSKVDLSREDENSKHSVLKKLIKEDASRAFDLSKDILLRVNLLRFSDNEHYILFNMHHIISDGWSTAILIREFSQLYEAYKHGADNPLAPLEVQYADYAQWQRQWLQDEGLQTLLEYWQHQLANLPQVHNLPLDNARPAKQTYRGASCKQRLSTNELETIKAFCKQHNVTLFMFLQSAFSILLSRYSGEKDIVVGTATAGRVHRQLEPLIGLFVNDLVLRSDLSSNPDFLS
ncbi:MAG TPA: condensation domain-containing protein, partial [Cellvibrio sp.]